VRLLRFSRILRFWQNLENLNNLDFLTMQFAVVIYDKFRVKHVVNHLIAQT
jgi:hypothetical protein